MRILFTHGHLIVDENTEYIDGAVFIENDKILKVYPHTNKIKDEFLETEIVNLKGSILMPAFFDTHYTKKQIGVGSCLLNIDDSNKINLNSKTRYLGLFIDNPNKLDKLNNNIKDVKGICVDLSLNNHHEIIKNNNIKVLLGKSNIYYKDININYDGIRNIFNNMKGLDAYNPSLANAAFIDNKYVEFNTDIHESMLKLLLKNISRNKLILVSNNMYESILKLKNLGITNTDILSYSSLNAYKLYNLDNYYGSLRKGKFADFVVMDKNYKILFSYIKGELINE